MNVSLLLDSIDKRPPLPNSVAARPLTVKVDSGCARHEFGASVVLMIRAAYGLFGICLWYAQLRRQLPHYILEINWINLWRASDAKQTIKGSPVIAL
jgi:hypothetical protein